MAGQPKGNPGAPLTAKQLWDATDWSRVRRHVHRLQVRIAKAAKEDRWGKVKALQRILVTSRSAKLLAVKTVTSNKGKSTPGIDKIVWRSATAKLRAVDALGRHGYSPKPLLRKFIPKSNGKMRPLGIPTMHDRAMQALHALALQPLAEVQADGHSYGFRPRRCVADAIKQCFNVLAQDFRAKWVLEGDIKACFDQISHQWLIDHVPMDKTILQRWLKAGFIDKEVFNRTDAGTPQGGIISPILANLALDGLQARIAEVAPKGGKVCFVRYADDFICTAEDPELLETVIKPTIESFLAERGLALSQEKTVITHIRDGFDFLGFNIRKYGKKLLIKPSKEKISGFKQRLKECIRRLRYEKAHLVIAEFNRRAKGWANFYRHVVSKKVFGEIDSAVFRYLWRELRRRHPKKSVRWVKKKYFTTRRGNHWILFGRERTDDAYRDHYLFKLASCRIRRHIKVIAKATPFDPEYDSYFERREARIKDSRLRDRRASPLTRTRWRSLQGQLELFNAGSLVRP